MFTAGTPVNAPAGGAVLVTSQIVTTARQYTVRVMVATAEPFWATITHRRPAGGAVSQIFLPVNSLFGPENVGTYYMDAGDYVEVAVRNGAEPAGGTVQATVEIL